MDCYAEAEIVAHFAKLSVGGFNAKATQTSGVIACEPRTATSGQSGVKWLDAVTADGETTLASATHVSRMFGGLQFDTSFSDSNHMQHEGCQHKGEHCHNLTPEQGLFNVLQTVFTGTAAGAYYGEPTILTPPGRTAPFNYLQIYDDDIVYATDNSQCFVVPAGLCTVVKIRNHVTGEVVGTMTAQDELVKASRQILNKVSELIVLSLDHDLRRSASRRRRQKGITRLAARPRSPSVHDAGVRFAHQDGCLIDDNFSPAVSIAFPPCDRAARAPSRSSVASNTAFSSTRSAFETLTSRSRAPKADETGAPVGFIDGCAVDQASQAERVIVGTSNSLITTFPTYKRTRG